MIFLSKNVSKLKVPCLIMYGTSDGIVPSDVIREFCSNVGSADKKLRSFKGLIMRCSTMQADV